MQGLTIWTTSVFIVGDIAGGGVLALPRAVEDTGWIGFILIVVFTLISTYTAALIGRYWVIIQERYPEYQAHVPDPYPVMGEKAYGQKGRHLVTVTMNIYNFGSSVVYMVLAAGNIEALLSNVTDDISFCYWLLILAGILAPLVCLGTPKDFWPIGVGATFTTGIACVLIVIQAIEDKTSKSVVHEKIDPLKFSTSFGTMVFAVSGHSVFPTIIADMKNKSDFKMAAMLGYGIVLLMYIPTALSGYIVYGKDVNVNIIKSISSGPLAHTVEVLVTLHLLLGFIIYMNPVCQQFEAKVGVPKAFTWKRCVVRFLIILVVLFFAESVPHFGAILSLVGGSTTTLLSYVFPCLFYMKLCRNRETIGVSPSSDKVLYSVQDEEQLNFETESERSRLIKKVASEAADAANDGTTSSDVRRAKKQTYKPQQLHQNIFIIPLWQKVLNYEIICIGIIGGVAATVSAIIAIATPDSFSVPCYINIHGAGT